MASIEMDSPEDKFYKGKATDRSWSQLPEHLVRYIATFYLNSLASTSYSPQTWESRELWHQRMVYTLLRDAVQFEKNVMSTCLAWHRALQNHLFWHQAITLIDPLDYFAAHMLVPNTPKPSSMGGRGSSTQNQSALPPFSQLSPAPIRITWWRHFHNILQHSCVICRINAPPTSIGLASVHHSKDRRTAMFTPYLGLVSVCRDHERRKAAFCGLCLREAPIYESATANVVLGQYGLNNHHSQTQAHAQALGNLVMSVACVENEDEETWPNVEATCRSCRLEWLWKKTNGNERDREAVAGPTALRFLNQTRLLSKGSSDDLPPNLASLVISSEDWETRQSIECFLDLGEGTISELLCLAREKYWLRKHTKLSDMMMQALAARKWTMNPGDLSRMESPERGSGSKEEDGQILQLEEVATITSTTRTLSSSSSDVASDGGNVERHATSDTTIDSHRPTLREITDDFESAVDEEESVEDEEEEEDDEDAALLQTEENGVKELALGDWARARILDGYWISPADSWYNLDTGYPSPSPKCQKAAEVDGEGQSDETRKGDTWTYAVNPCPWTVEKGSEGSDRMLELAEGGSSAADGADNGSEHRGDDTRTDREMEESHPRWSTVIADIPPSYSLCEQAYIAHQRQMRCILLPAMKNVVRKIVMECSVAAASARSAGGSLISTNNSALRSIKRKRNPNPAIVASRMTLEDVVKIMREEEGVWFDGVDWIERMKNEEEGEDERIHLEQDKVKRKRERKPYGEVEGVEGMGGLMKDHGPGSYMAINLRNESPLPKKRRISASSSPETEEQEGHLYEVDYRSGTNATAPSASSGSGSGTSPVLSTTTLETTPSPPMFLNKRLLTEDGTTKNTALTIPDDDPIDIDELKIAIPISPVLEAPRLLRPIPYIPTSIARFPQYTMESLRLVWKEACSPLYHCRCRICERTAQALAAAAKSHNGNPYSTAAIDERPIPPTPRVTTPVLARESRQPQQQTSIPDRECEITQQKVEHDGEVLEVVLNEAEFDSDEVVEINFEDALSDDSQEGKEGGDINNAAYYFRREREQHGYTDRQDERQARETKKKVERDQHDLLSYLNDAELQSFKFARVGSGNFIDLSVDDDDCQNDVQEDIVQSPLLSDDVGDTMSHADSVDSSHSSRKRSCDELEVEQVGIHLAGDPLASPKRAKMTPTPPIHHTPRKRPSGSHSSPRIHKKISEERQASRTPSPPVHVPELPPMLRKRNSEELGADHQSALDSAKVKKARLSVSLGDVVITPVPDIGVA